MPALDHDLAGPRGELALLQLEGRERAGVLVESDTEVRAGADYVSIALGESSTYLG